jgi:hypothetical protein
MRKSWLIIVGLALVASLLGTVDCTAPTHGGSGFGLIFRYGVMARNELNTFKGTFTKDMVSDPSITVNLSLSEEELDSIYRKMVEIDFFDYPDEFSVSVLPWESVGMITPHSSYYFKVEYDSKVKELRWEDKITNKDEKADKLRELIKLIRDIIESKEEYQKLPKPTSGYL